MERRRSITAVVAVSALVATLAGAPVATAEEFDHLVQAGALHPSQPDRPYEYTRFYPPVLDVHRGQTVQWMVVGDGVVSGFHTITFADAGRPAFIRADDLPGTYATPEEWSIGSACGRNGLPACVFDEDTSFLSSGIPPFGNSPFQVTIDVPQGMYSYFCTVHPAMSGALRVVPDSQPLPSSEEIEAEVTAAIQADTEAADALWDLRQDPVSTIEDGQRVWRVLVGDATPDDHVSLNAYLPATLDIEAGDKVRFQILEPVVNEVHTVTFPSAVTGGFSPVPHGLGGFGFYASCDPDDTSTGAKGIPGTWGIAGPDCPANLEIAIAPWMTAATPAPGGLVLTPATVHDSGILIPPGAPANFRELPGSGRVLPASFEGTFPLPGDFPFECNVHVDPMAGVIRVA
ncbi:MAG TPA: hypothetical protein VGB52_13120 [Actinomycetota bacterium]